MTIKKKFENVPHRIHKKNEKKVKEELLDKVEEIQASYEHYSRNNFFFFVRGITIDGQRGPITFERCMAPFQKACFEDMADSLRSLRDGKNPEKKRFWIERTKKASKDADLALIILWLVAFVKRPFYIQVGAADRDQAKIVKDRIENIIHYNPWLSKYVEVVQWQVRSTKTKLGGTQPLALVEILSSDISGAHGGTPDLLIINELSHMTKWEFAENLMDNADGVAQGMVIIATNAGFKGTKAEVWRNNALASPDWYPHILASPAPWHDKKFLEDAKKRNTHSRNLRLWKGVWVSGKGDALSDEAIEWCFQMKGPESERKPGLMYIGGLDIGISHDHSALVVLAVDPIERMVKTAYWKAFEPNSETGEVDLQYVEAECIRINQIFVMAGLYYDPTEARLMAQRLRTKIAMRPMQFTPKNLSLMAESLIQVVESRRLLAYDDQDGTLRRDFGKFDIVEKPYGYKLEAVSDEFGHADVGTALVIALPECIRLMDGLEGLQPTDDLVDLNEDPLSEDEIEELPLEMREIFELDAEQARNKLDDSW